MVIPTHLPQHQRDQLQKTMPPEFSDHIPLNEKPKNLKTLPFAVKKQDLNLGNRKKINIDETEDTIHNPNELNAILQRGARLRQQMEQALDPSTSAWEQIHGIHHVPKTYVPPFMQDEMAQMKEMASPEKIRDKIYDYEIEAQAETSPISIKPRIQDQRPLRPDIDLNKEQNLEQFGENQEGKRQIQDMKFIRVKVKTLRVEDETVLHRLIEEGLSLQIETPLPDIYQKKISSQSARISNYEVISFNEYAFNSLQLYNFRVDEATLAQFVNSDFIVSIPELKVKGLVKMNKLILAPDFNLKTHIDLGCQVKKSARTQKKTDKKRSAPETEEFEDKHVGSVEIHINLQSGDSEEEMKRNYQIQMQRMEEERSKQEAEKQELARKKMTFQMQQNPVFGQVYLHIDKLGHNDNIGLRDPSQPLDIETQAKLQADAKFTQDQDNAPDTVNLGEVVMPSRNLYVQFKAFPNLEPLRTNTVFQQDSESAFNFRAQFPVLMCPETIERMEKFIFVLELWDQLSPSVQEFLGFVKIPLAPICFSMLTTDQEVYSLNFMADQFCLYPMIVSDGFLPIYSPKQGQDIGHLKVTLAMGSPVQVNRLIQKEQEEEKKRLKEIEKQKMWEAQQEKEKELKEAKRIKKEKKRQLEEEQKKREEERREKEAANNPLNQLLSRTGSGGRGVSPSGPKMQDNLVAILAKSIQGEQKKDYENKRQSMLSCLRKLFYEAKTQHFDELNGELLFPDSVKNLDGTVDKEIVMQSLLNNDKICLTRLEVAGILSLMLDINRDDKGKVDVDEIHLSYLAFSKYQEQIEQRVVDLLEKFKISVVKKFELHDLVLDFAREVEDKACESKIKMEDFRDLLEGKHGIFIRDTLYDQFLSYFDLNRDNQVYITSFCEYLRNPSEMTINFFKVSPSVISQQICEYVKNAVESQKGSLEQIEEELKKEIWKQSRLRQIKERRVRRGEMGEEDELEALEDDDEPIPGDLLISEKINAKLFQFKLKRQGVVLSLWEVFTIFEDLNVKIDKLFFEPQRYHHLMFGNFYKFITGEDYNRETVYLKRKRQLRNQRPVKQQKQEQKQEESEEEQQSEIESEDSDGGRVYRQVKHVFEIKVKELKNIPLLNKFIQQTHNQVEFFSAPSSSNKYIQNVAVKYSFPLDEDEVLESDYIQLDKDALDGNGLYNYSVSMDTVHTYLIGKDDDIKHVLQTCLQRGQAQLQNQGSGLSLIRNDGDFMSNSRREELFTISISLYQDNREYSIGSAHLPIEDLIETIGNHQNRCGTYDRKQKVTTLQRTLFLYGTSYSQRENCIIGKLILEVVYSQEKIYLSKKDAIAYKQEMRDKRANGEKDKSSLNPYTCFMHRETYINRKIPLNAKLSVLVDRVQSLKESIENIEHFSKIQHSLREEAQSELGLTSMVQNRNDLEHLDRRRVLRHIMKHGLNIVVLCSMFEEDASLSKKFQSRDSISQQGNLSKYQTRMLYNSFNPVFGEVFDLNLQMDTQIFEYLKNKRAVFEIRHYIVESQKQRRDKLRESRANWSDEDINQREDLDSHRTIQDYDVLSNCDYLVLGHARVPLLQLITKNNGVDGDFNIYDEFKQKMGTLKLRITLNHFNSQRPLYQTSTKAPNQPAPAAATKLGKQTLIDHSLNLNNQARVGTLSKVERQRQKFILGLNFIELLLKKREDLLRQLPGLQQKFFLKFTFANTNYQTKFLAKDKSTSTLPIDRALRRLNLQVLAIKKSTFVELDLFNQSEIESLFGKPLEIQLWHKIESARSYEKPVKEELVGHFTIDLNEISRITNRRLKGSQTQQLPGKLQVFEGYFTLHDSQRDMVCSDRLGMRVMVFPKDESSETLTTTDLNQIFNEHAERIEETIALKLDKAGKGYAERDELIETVKGQINDIYLSEKVIWFIKQSLESKNVDKVYYSPLFGLPPPFLREQKKFDNLEIISRVNETLENLDSGDNGFVPVNVFRNALEGELNFKTKIIDDFINNSRDEQIENSNPQSLTKIVKDRQTLDVNLVTSSLKTSHVDFIILVRKLAEYLARNHSVNQTYAVVEEVREKEEPKEVEIMSPSKKYLRESMQVYEGSLANASEDTIDELHRFNMMELDKLNSKLRDTLTVVGCLDLLDKPKEGFGKETFQTDNQRVTLQKMRQSLMVENPFKRERSLEPDEDIVRDQSQPKEWESGVGQKEFASFGKRLGRDEEGVKIEEEDQMNEEEFERLQRYVFKSKD